MQRMCIAKAISGAAEGERKETLPFFFSSKHLETHKQELLQGFLLSCKNLS